MTRSARRFVGPLTFEAITRREVITDQWKPGANADIEHISIASTIDLLLVAPATANIIGKFANGIADDFLSSLYLATTAPVLMAPAMNTNMFAHPAVVAESRDAGRARREVRRAGRGLSRVRLDRQGTSGRAGGRRRGRAARAAPDGSAGGQARAGDGGTDARRHRSGAVHRQSVQRAHGIRDRRRGRAAWRARDARVGPDDSASRRASTKSCRCEARRTCTRPCCRVRRRRTS